MESKALVRLLTSFVLIGAFASLSHPQGNVSTLWLSVSFYGAPADSIILAFANAPGASYGIDNLSPTFREFGTPYLPPGLTINWDAFRPAAGNPEFGGFWLDVHGIPTNPTVKDTFQLLVYALPHEADSANFGLVWPSASYILNRCDSLVLAPVTAGLVDLAGSPIPDRLDMTSTNRLDLLRPLLATTAYRFRFQIYRYGVKLVDYLSADPFVTDVEESTGKIPISFTLSQNYPNPFNPETKISYTIPKAGHVSLTVNDILGRQVASLVQENKQPGEYSVSWNAGGVPSGVYFYRLTAGDFISTKKMILIR